MERAWIISSGTELTLGRSVDTNAAWLAQQLAALGLRTDRIVTVPDAADALRDVLVQAADACDVIVLTGGLGPTDDDLTRQVLADVVGVPLELDAASLERLRAFFAERGRDLPPANRIQAMIPRSARALPNACGTAPGIAIELHGTPCFALPGVPFEMQAMFAREVAPAVRATARGRVLLSRQVYSFGVPESELGARLHDLMARGRNPEVGTSAQLGLIGVRISARAARRAEAEALLDQDEQDIRRRLGEAVFGRDGDTLASVVGELLVAAGRTLSTAESCTGGLLAELVTDVSGSSRHYLGGLVAYANEVKQRLLGVSRELLEQHGAVSEPAARAMAAGARRAFASDYALSVTGVAGPTGGSAEKPIGLVYLGLASPGAVRAWEIRLGSDTPRRVIRLRAAHTALDRLRLELLHAATGSAGVDQA